MSALQHQRSSNSTHAEPLSLTKASRREGGSVLRQHGEGGQDVGVLGEVAIWTLILSLSTRFQFGPHGLLEYFASLSRLGPRQLPSYPTLAALLSQVSPHVTDQSYKQEGRQLTNAVSDILFVQALFWSRREAGSGRVWGDHRFGCDC